MDLLDAYLKDRQAALLLITHDLGLAARRVHRLMVMDDGKIVEDAPTERFLMAPKTQAPRRFVHIATGCNCHAKGRSGLCQTQFSCDVERCILVARLRANARCCRRKWCRQIDVDQCDPGACSMRDRANDVGRETSAQLPPRTLSCKNRAARSIPACRSATL